MVIEYDFGDFRRLQVSSDLARLALLGGRLALERIATAIPAEVERTDRMTDDLAAFLRDDTPLPADILEDLCPRLLLTAAQPQLDMSAFLTATATSLLEQIGPNSCDEPLDEHWDVFADVYKVQDPLVRSVIMQGFLYLRRLERVTLSPMPGAEDIRTNSQGYILTRLKLVANTAEDRFLRDTAALLEHAVETIEASGKRAVHWRSRAGRHWREHAPQLCRHPSTEARDVWRGFRHLYEVIADWDPYADDVTTSRIAIPFSIV
ncbi:MAG: hypothetical protein ACFB11_12725 [Paracoccaceae bacterium]